MTAETAAAPVAAPTPFVPLAKSARTACYVERDSFYQCCRELGAEYNPANEVPAKCQNLRAAFFTACPATWVKHFDAQQETLARKVKYLAKAIDGKASTAAGTLSGKSQI
ncbi:MAG: hypothetical protein WDW38_009350 [Sanguina aurantia]